MCLAVSGSTALQKVAQMLFDAALEHPRPAGIAGNLQDVIHTFTQSLVKWEKAFKHA
jgi:hypothetical protein